MGSASLSAQITDLLLHGHKTGTQIAEDLGANQDSVRRTLGRLEKRDKVVRLTGTTGGRGKETLWGLRDRNRDTEPF
jgi:predicted ArsR family transcriptional regulator